jgi:hypothetical protein
MLLYYGVTCGGEEEGNVKIIPKGWNSIMVITKQEDYCHFGGMLGLT